MTYREYLKECDEFERAVILVNLGRRVPENLPKDKQRKMMQDFLDEDFETQN